MELASNLEQGALVEEDARQNRKIPQSYIIVKLETTPLIEVFTPLRFYYFFTLFNEQEINREPA